MSKGNDNLVQSAQDFANLCKILLKETEVVFLSAEYIRNMVDIIKPWEDIEKVPGISRMHIIECSEGKVSMWENAKFKDTTVAKSP